jgi:hypothetical protein
VLCHEAYCFDDGFELFGIGLASPAGDDAESFGAIGFCLTGFFEKFFRTAERILLDACVVPA